MLITKESVSNLKEKTLHHWGFTFEFPATTNNRL